MSVSLGAIQQSRVLQLRYRLVTAYHSPTVDKILTLANLLRIRPMGVVSKKLMGARHREAMEAWWIRLLACQPANKLMIDLMDTRHTYPRPKPMYPPR